MTGQRWVVDAAGGKLEEDIKTFCKFQFITMKIKKRKKQQVSM